MFIEVKTRSQNNFGSPRDAVDRRKKKHIYNAAEYFILINGLENVYCRIDVIEVYINKNSTKINYIKNCILEKTYKEFKIKEGDELL